MSFKQTDNNYLLDFSATETQNIASSWQRETKNIAEGARSPVFAKPVFISGDSRKMSSLVGSAKYDVAITSPPYPNRMSYIRELRPYMYWLGFLRDSQAAGQLDWLAIGGTWGSATSSLMKWSRARDSIVPYHGFAKLIQAIGNRSTVSSRYVDKYFHDMHQHCQELFGVLKSGAKAHYIVGNSKFYDLPLPVEDIFAALFDNAGFEEIRIENFRKRSSKKELFEFVVSAKKPSG